MMAPVGKNRDSPSSNRKGGKEKAPAGLSRKQPRRWDTHQFRGSLQEGQGFAIWRKQKIQRAYKKLLKKERHVNPQKNVGYTEDYPEHLKHLYLAEEEMLRKQQKPKHKPVVLEEKETVTSKYQLWFEQDSLFSMETCYRLWSPCKKQLPRVLVSKLPRGAM
ncbi:PREDICTED: thyroid transcription factor 1-associated protein 26 isoform X1 [Thamnophis sirtalis]|uniref:Thyroid transcription factor 1-associated protein 26 isoform X1 n=1 Tax=Thamnophis sirtalis TaxID=35019 RepID=A0A6I9WZR9_9SAUR|nr:PREDICTED: thyroid transcription factor 1-associated protein 26 isoform X1 [Thamnophis sirtalis]XP_032077148.1 thyroid transcription factor 1-associated protein 26 isoform X1 [Thamnophis elegans]